MIRRALFLALFLSLPVIAQQTNNEIAISYGRTETEDLGDAPAVGISYARFWTRGLATRVGGQWSGEDLPDNAGDNSVNAYFATAEYHFFRDRLMSPYIGGGIAHAFADIHFSSSGFRGDDSMYTAMVIAGADVNFTRRFAVGVDARYMTFDPDLGDRFGTILDPMTVFVSAKYRY